MTTSVDRDFPTPEADRLTGRESEMLTMIARGLSNREIAEATELSPNSIKSFIRSAYRKIGVERRDDAVAWVGRRGLDGEPAA